MAYFISGIPTERQIAGPRALKATQTNNGMVQLAWECDEEGGSYEVYRSHGSQPDYELITSGIKGYSYQHQLNADDESVIFKVVRLKDGQKSKGATTCFCVAVQ